MVINFALFNCLNLLLPYEAEIANRFDIDLFFEKCTIERKINKNSELVVVGSADDQLIRLVYDLDENCNFTAPRKPQHPFSVTEKRLYGKLPGYFFKNPDWGNICKHYW